MLQALWNRHLPFYALTAAILFFSAEFAGAQTSTTAGAQSPQVSDWTDVETILNHRCVVCHSCYDAPCQLKLTSPAGLLRGASKEAVYHTERLTDAQPTRLGIDAQTVPEWRKLGFFPVVQSSGQSDNAGTVLERYLELGRQAQLPTNAPVPAELGLEIDRPLVCPTAQEFDAFRNAHPLAGMPYATAPLGNDEYQVLMSWARSGAPMPSALPEVPEDIQAQIADWEAFLNHPDPRNQLMSRYVYEHLFLARLHFPADDTRLFFQLVRSTTAPGSEIDIIATRRPFDDPGSGLFYYRLQPIVETIVHKDHLVYKFGPDRMARYQQLFLDPAWSVSELPAYGDAEGGNPFSTFAGIPARSRYQFLLDDALFFVRSFIRGPVCHGETAVDVIEDRFWVSFLDPDADLSVTDPSFLADGAAFLELPVADLDGRVLGDLQGLSHENQVKYLEFRDDRYRNSAAHLSGFGYDAIWDGDGTNRQALITVFRHFDNASAMTGFHGGIPETAWVIDFPVFERIYYDLVAGYDVFGRVEHQLSTRLYMDELRMESEDTFLNFMPRGIRQKMHETWYDGALAEFHTYWHRRRVDDSFPTGIDFATSTPKQEFLLELLNRGHGLWAVEDTINRCAEADCSNDDTGILFDLRALANQTGDWVRYLPDVSLLLVETDDGSSALYSLLHDKAHYNVAFLFDEKDRRNPQTDVLTILPGVIGSYPNFFFSIRQDQLASFVSAVKSVRSQEEWVEFVATYGLRRTSPDFWETSDQVSAMFLQQAPIEAGVLDLNRYKDPRSSGNPENN
ncbi:fatty acid cis/trans isomerase [Ruegeria sp. Ofav3-42]|uniref:fatty acid cis/trans isomerase n=1 Tax=Ruegeria sp. Ofav3-42 TaxID=2917759 RepID=UPI001EF530F1|nr:fatty acid cis/trans isomerase [Ruegeria sp. Ofav3-42]MCG7519963.1 fatty acid cis/trans isomerase [Ruegeria sp. Ofav3-42]